MSILIFSPYSGVGGGKAVQLNFSLMIEAAWLDNVNSISRIGKFIFELLKNINSTQLIFIQSIFNPKSLFILLVVSFLGFRNRVVMVPRGDRIPKSIFDCKIKNPSKKFIYWLIVRKIYKNLFFLFSSSVESEYFQNNSRVKIKESIILADPYRPLKQLHDRRTYKIFPRKIVFLGRVDFEKNIKFLFDIFEAGMFYKKNIEFSIVGPISSYMEPEIKLLLSEASRKMLASIKFYGEIQDVEEKMNLIKNSIVCLPSHYESFGLVCLEAVEAGSYFISTNESYWKNIHEDFGVGIELDKKLWLRRIDSLISEGYLVDHIKRDDFLNQFHPLILAKILRQTNSCLFKATTK